MPTGHLALNSTGGSSFFAGAGGGALVGCGAVLAAVSSFFLQPGRATASSKPIESSTTKPRRAVALEQAERGVVIFMSGVSFVSRLRLNMPTCPPL